MRRERLVTSILAASFPFLGELFGGLAQANAVWHNDWVVSAPPTLSTYSPAGNLAKPSAAVAFDANGEVLFGAESASTFDYQFIRLSASGALRWATNLSDTPSTAGAYALLPDADGGAFFALGNYGADYSSDWYDHVVRTDGNGAPVWLRAVPTGWIANVAPGRLASAGCSELSVLDAVSGDLVWQRQINSFMTSCTTGGVAADVQSNLYATFPIGVGTTITGFRVIKFAPNGDALWNVADSSTIGGSVVGLGGTLLYVSTATDLRAVRVGDGSVAWSLPIEANAMVRLSTDSPPEPIVIGTMATRRLSADSGQVRWTQAVGHDFGAGGEIVGGAVLVQSTDLVKLDAGTGAIVWHTALPGTDASGNPLVWIDYGGFSNGSFDAVAKDTSPGAPPDIQRIDFATGALTSTVAIPSVAQGVWAADLTDDNGHVLSVSYPIQLGAPAVRMRSVDTTTGATEWEIDQPDDGYYDYYGGAVPGIALAGDGVAIAIQPLNPYDAIFPAVWLYERATGQRRWETSLFDLNAPSTGLSGPAADAGGNVIVATTGTSLSPPNLRQTVYKLAAGDGSVLWRNDANALLGDQLQILTLRETVVLIGNSAIQGLSDVDGSVTWTTAPLFGEPIDNTYPLADGTLIVTGEHGWTKLDLNTGVVVWTSTYPTSCLPNSGWFSPCAFGVALTNGDLISISSNPPDYQTRGFRLHGDGSGLVDAWTLDSGDPSVYSAPDSIVRDSLDQVWLSLRRRNHSPGSVLFLTRVDTNSGTLQGQQAIAATSDELMAWAYATPLGPPVANRLLVSTTSAQSPQPTTNGVALIDTSVTAQGDLSIQVTVDYAHVVPGAMLGFHVRAAYSGDKPISGVQLATYLPWQTGVSALTCVTQAASNCVLDSRSGNVHATFDIQPGGMADITGQVPMSVTFSELPALSASIYGPTALIEQNTVNNFARAQVEQSLFFDGFDGN